MPARKVDYIIIGQGLAGSVLAHQLILRNKKILVIDNNHHQSSSKVAAGIINPITGPRLVLTDTFNDTYPQAQQYYSLLEKTLGITLWQELKQHRLIQTNAQAEYLHKRSTDIHYQHTLGSTIFSPYFESDFGSVEINQSAIIDSKLLIQTAQQFLIENQSYDQKKLDYQQLIFTDNGFRIDDTVASHIIFCEGFQAINNPWLADLPFKLSKGEILTVETNKPVTHLLNWGNWLVPFGHDTKLGSNYQWGDLTDTLSDSIKTQLLQSLHSNTTVQGRIINHEAGIRPTTTQRKPFIGPITNLSGAYCFNGFGSKGCLLIPHFAELFCDHLLNNTPLDTNLTQWL